MRAVIHIGAEKTGSTALQRCFEVNRAAMVRAGIHFPESVGGKQHWSLALYGLDSDRRTEMTDRMDQFNDDREGWRRGIEEALAGELADVQPDVLLISTELFSSYLIDAAEVQRVKDLLDRWCDDYRIVCYLRRQDRARASHYSTFVRTGGTSLRVLGDEEANDHRFEYESILDHWASVFGDEAVVPRNYDAVRREGRDLLDDFVDAGALPLDSTSLERPRRQNESLSSKALEVLRGFNARAADWDPDLETQHVRRVLTGVVEYRFPGKPPRPSRDEARAYLSGYAEANARVARRWFGTDELFDADFDDYPEVADGAPTLESGEVLDVMTEFAERLVNTPAAKRKRLSRKRKQAAKARVEATAGAGAPARRLWRRGR